MIETETSTAASGRINWFGCDREMLETLFADRYGGKPFRARQFLKWVYHQGVRDSQAMTNLAQKVRDDLGAIGTFDLPEVVEFAESVDGTMKWAVRVGGGNLVETVMIPDRGRNTLCVSSQAGCVLDCSFCSTGKQGFSGNLTTAEIIGQVLIANAALAERGEAVTNIVFMGMGEPLLNFDQVVPAVKLLMDDLAFGISKRRVTISTAGVVPQIEALSAVTDCSLAISLHAPTNELRNELVPLNRKYPLEVLLPACNRYVEGLGEKRSLTMEYTLIDGINDSLADAHELVNLLRNVRCKINLIPFNPFPGTSYRTPSNNRIRAFQTVLLDAGCAAMLRTTRGADIDAACGQLVGAVKDRTRRQARYRERLASLETEAMPIRVQGDAVGGVR